MGQRFQVYVNYGANGEENLFAMHLQWCWGPYAVIRAHQLLNYLDGARNNPSNPFGLGSRRAVDGLSHDGRREDLYLLRALTEINPVSCSIVEGDDLLSEANEWDLDDFKKGEISSFPDTVTVDPYSQDNNDGILVIKATEEDVRYAFCKDNIDLDPINASAYMTPYQSDLDDFDDKGKKLIACMVQDLNGSPLLTREEMESIFDKAYRKDLNIEGYKAPGLTQAQDKSLSELAKEARSRIGILAHESAENAPPQREYRETAR